MGWTSINPSYDLGWTKGTRVLTHPQLNFHWTRWSSQEIWIWAKAPWISSNFTWPATAEASHVRVSDCVSWPGSGRIWVMTLLCLPTLSWAPRAVAAQWTPQAGPLWKGAGNSRGFHGISWDLPSGKLTVYSGKSLSHSVTLSIGSPVLHSYVSLREDTFKECRKKHGGPMLPRFCDHMMLECSWIST